MTALSQADIKALLIRLLPTGREQLYDLDNQAFIGATLYGLAGALKDTLTDRIDVLRSNVNPSSLTLEGLPEWEAACGLAYTPVALWGTLNQRINAVIAALRLSGSFSLDDIRAIVQPYFLYQRPAEIQIIETDRAALQALHTYAYATPVTISTGNFSATQVSVLDDPQVSAGGAHLLVNLTGYTGDIDLALVSPDGTLVSFPQGTLPPASVTAVGFELCAPAFAGRSIKGWWTLRVHTGAYPLTVNSWAVFVEGIGVNYNNLHLAVGEGLGAAMFEFVIVADPTKLGTGFDLPGAQRAIGRWKPAHTRGAVTVMSGVMGASFYAIPDTTSATPDAAIPGP